MRNFISHMWDKLWELKPKYGTYMGKTRATERIEGVNIWWYQN